MELVAQLHTDFIRTLQYLDEAMNPVNLEGYSVAAEVRSAPGGALILDLIPTIVDAITGTIKIDIPHTALTAAALKLHLVRETATLRETLGDGTFLEGTGKYSLFDIILTDADQIATKILSGKIVFVPTVTGA